MEERKTYLKNMINSMVEENRENAAAEFHKFLAIKMKETIQKVTSGDTQTTGTKTTEE